jgi:hypothetical protein
MVGIITKIIMSVVSAERKVIKPMKDTEKTFLLTDSCMWEANRQSGSRAPHAIEVVDTETGQVRYIKSGSLIRFVDGDITLPNTQEMYNEQQDSVCDEDGARESNAS